MRKYFSRNYVISSPKLNEDQKKVFAKTWGVFFPKLGEDQKKGLHRNSGQYLVGICRIDLCWLAFFCLIIQRSNLDGGLIPPTIYALFVRVVVYSGILISATS